MNFFSDHSGRGWMMKDIIGVDIGGTKTAIVYASCGGQICFQDKAVFETRTDLGLDYTLEKILEGIKAMASRHSLETFAVGISCGGPLDAKSGVILGPPNLPGWDRVPIVDIMRNRFGVKAYLRNDADACALAEWKAGAGRGCSNIIFITFGTGLGAGLILNGRLYSGASGMAGEIGHIRLASFGPSGYGKQGSFEGFCSGGGIEQLSKTMLLAAKQSGKKSRILDEREINKITAKDIFAYAGEGEPVALSIVKVIGEHLGMGLSILIDILNPERIIIGSIFERNHALLSPFMNDVLAREALTFSLEDCNVIPASLGDKIGDYAAVLAAVYGLDEEGL